MALDGTGGFFVVWGDNRNPGGADLYGQRMTSDGAVSPGWTINGQVVCGGPGEQLAAYILADGAGGIFVPFALSPGLGGSVDTYLQHVTGSGALAPGFGPAGVPVAVAPGNQTPDAAALDGSGGIFMLWWDPPSQLVYGQHLMGDGSLDPSWPSGGKVLSTPGVAAYVPSVASDGAGGVVAAWWEDRPLGANYYTYAYRLTATGDPYPGWPVHGVLLGTGAAGEPPVVISDGAGGMYVAWSDLRSAPSSDPYNDNYFDIYAAHVLADGTVAKGWPVTGLAVCVLPRRQSAPMIVSDGLGGAIVSWADYRNEIPPNNYAEDIYASRLKPDGTLSPGWMPNGNGIAVGPGFQDPVGPVTDGNHGAYVGIDGSGPDLCFVQHVMGDGTIDPTYGPTGNPVTPGVTTTTQTNLSIVSDGSGGAYASWDDPRGGGPGNIWATRIGPNAVTAIAVSLMNASAEPDHVQLAWQAARQLRATVERREGSGPWQALGDVTTDGQNRLIFDDHSVTPGTSYGYRLSYVDGTTTEHTAETTILVPRAYTLALSGFRPNPSTGADLAISFELPSTAPGRLELLDVTGRRVAERDLSSYGAGRYSERIGEGARVPAGMYWIRLTHGGRALTARGAVLR